MTKKEAIKNIKEHCYFASLIPQAKEALDVAIKALEQDPCEDAISRQTVIDAIEDDNRNGHYSCFASNNDAECFKQIIRDLPSVHSKQKWIPVSERLPDNDCECWVTVTFVSGMRNIVNSCNYTNDLYDLDKYAFENRKGGSGFYNYDSEYGYYEIYDVIAWMPYFEPKPYKEVSE